MYNDYSGKLGHLEMKYFFLFKIFGRSRYNTDIGPRFRLIVPNPMGTTSFPGKMIKTPPHFSISEPGFFFRKKDYLRFYLPDTDRINQKDNDIH